MRSEKLYNKCKEKNYPYTSSEELCEMIAKKQDECFISFSGGKDSIACMIVAKRFFKKVVPVFFYRIPGLSFIDEKIKYFEEFFGERIIKLPHPSTIAQLNGYLFQDLEHRKIIERTAIPTPTYDMFFDKLREKYGIQWVGIGNRAHDNMQRWTAFVTNGAINYNRQVFWPVFDYSNDDVLQLIKEAKIYMPDDYRMFGKTFDSLQERFISVIKKEYPQDFERIKLFFPLIEIENLRYEKYAIHP